MERKQKGTIELTQGALVYIVIMLIVIAVGIALVMGSNALAFFGIGKLKTNTEPGRINVQTYGGFYASCSYNGKTYVNSATMNNVYFSLNDPTDEEGRTLSFYLIMDIGQEIIIGTHTGSDGKPDALFSCNKEGTCQADSISFQLPNGQLKGTQMHVTAWRVAGGTKEFVVAIQNREDRSFAQLLDLNAPAYLGSVGFVDSADFDKACEKSICDTCGGGYLDTNTCDKPECEGLAPFCYADTGFTGGITGIVSCKPCAGVTGCGYPDEPACIRCADNTNNCAWINNHCVAKSTLPARGTCNGLDASMCTNTLGCWLQASSQQCFDCEFATDCSVYDSNLEACGVCPVEGMACKTTLLSVDGNPSYFCTAVGPFDFAPITPATKEKILFVPVFLSQNNPTYDDFSNSISVQFQSFLNALPSECRSKFEIEVPSRAQFDAFPKQILCPIDVSINIQLAQDYGYNPNNYDIVVSVGSYTTGNIVGISQCKLVDTLQFIYPTAVFGKGNIWYNSKGPDSYVFAHEMGHIFGLDDQYCSTEAGGSSICNNPTSRNPMSASLGCDPAATTGPNVCCGTPAGQPACTPNVYDACCLGNKVGAGRSIMSSSGIPIGGYDPNEINQIKSVLRC